jgi:xanthine dehydrogenase accessory factor
VHLVAGGYSVILGHDTFPPVIRRAMAFHDALFGDRAAIEEIEGEQADTAAEIAVVLRKPGHVVYRYVGHVAMVRCHTTLLHACVDQEPGLKDLREVTQLKRRHRRGSDFAASINCDIAIEARPIRIGSIVREGWTDHADGISRPLGGFGRERFAIGATTARGTPPSISGCGRFRGLVAGHLNGVPVEAPFDRVLRGIVRDSTPVAAGVKLLEIDVRSRKACWTGIDERSLHRTSHDQSDQSARQADGDRAERQRSVVS